MMERILFLLLAGLCAGLHPAVGDQSESSRTFGEFPGLDALAVGEWWTRGKDPNRNPKAPPSLDMPRDQVVVFALYTHDRGVLKLTAQLAPLKPGEPRVVRLELKQSGKWAEVAKENVVYPGWTAHFRMEDWDASRDVPYRVRHGAQAMFEGRIRRDPVDKDVIVVGNLSCNSSKHPGPRTRIVDNLKAQNPDLLFFSGDQSYRHQEATAGWIEFGLQFRDVIRDRPTITIPDDHDVGHGNLWGENGRLSTLRGHADGGYKYPPSFVNMVQRQQTWHLPDPVDPRPVERGIGVYFTRLRVGGIDFAILEDRKFKSGPAGKIPRMGPRPDHINDPGYDPKSIDLPGLQLLGPRQEQFLGRWGEDWTGADLKAVLSQTAFCGAVHMHGSPRGRLLADLDCNGWPQTPRNRALRLIRRAKAVHLCGDQHLAVVVKHGIDQFGDGPYAFTSPAIVNTIYGRWWHPEDEKSGPNPVPGSPLPWTGDYLDGLGNRISMMAYANPEDRQDERKRADGYGIARFNRKDRTVTFEAWSRFAGVTEGDGAQFPGWPITVSVDDNDGRKITGYLPELVFSKGERPVVQVFDESAKEVLYTMRAPGDRFRPGVYSDGPFTVKCGLDHPERVVLEKVWPGARGDGREHVVRQGSAETRPPNIVIIFLDDAGFGDFHPFGKPAYATPHVQQLAAEGMRLNQFYVPQAVCSASRAALLSGCYPGRTRVFGAHGPGGKGLDPKFMTMAEMLKQNGYATAHFGKWHCGDRPETRPLARGFDEHAGLMYSNDMWKYHPGNPERWGKHPLQYWENGKVKIAEMEKADQEHLTRWATDYAVDFIRRKSGQPFFLYLAHSMPHVPLFCSPEFKGKSGTGLYGDVMMEIDWSVGQVVKALAAAGVAERTVVLFSSDNGPWSQYGNHAGVTPYREHKGTSFYGGIRSPTILKFPAGIKGGIQLDRAVCSIDLLPTLAHLTGSPLPDHEIDGRNIWPLLSGADGVANPHDYYAFSIGRRFESVISGDGRWKLHLPHAYRHVVETGRDGTPGRTGNPRIDLSLFDLEQDPHETTNVIEAHPEVAARLKEFTRRHKAKFYP